MKLLLSIFICAAVIGPGLITAEEISVETKTPHWAQWRGPLFTGEAPDADLPIKWEEGKNIKWKIPIPGLGLSTPVIWGNQLFITTAVPMPRKATAEEVKAQEAMQPVWMRKSGHGRTTDSHLRFVVFSIDRQTGKVLWQRNVREVFPHQGIHKTGSWASPSCATNGSFVVASFGSFGIYCFNMQGEAVWRKDLGPMNIKASFGEGISPVIYKDKLILNWDHEGPSALYVLELATGNGVWKKSRDEKTAWSTPLVVEVDNKPQIIVNATGASRGYDLATGDIVWELSGMTGNVIPAPVEAKGIAYLMSGFRGNAIQAIDLSKAKGRLEGTETIVWTSNKNAPYTPSPLLYQGKLYYLKTNDASLTCADAATGEIHYARQALANMRGVYASPVAAAGRIYIAGRNGVVHVIKPGPEFESLAINRLNDGFDASPAVAGKELYLRGRQALYCISKK